MSILGIVGIVAATWAAAAIITTILAALFFKGRNRAWESEKAHTARHRIDTNHHNHGVFPGTYEDR